MLELTIRQSKLLSFVKIMHGEQMRRYTNKHYWTHVLEVGTVAYEVSGIPLTLEIGLCHDLFEDTNCHKMLLYDFLHVIGYHIGEVTEIISATNELTDVFTTAKYPNLNRASRHELEARRLSKISNIAQTVKYADFLDNTKCIIKNDPGFAKRYIPEKKHVLEGCRSGNQTLLMMIENQIKAYEEAELQNALK